MTMKESSSPSCALALFYDNPRSAAELCSVTFLQKSRDKESHIITVSDNSYLISSPDTRWIQIFPEKALVQIVPCKVCIVKLPCACSLKAQTFYIPPTLEHCHKSLTPMVNQSWIFFYFISMKTRPLPQYLSPTVHYRGRKTFSRYSHFSIFRKNPRWLPKVTKIEVLPFCTGHSCTTLWVKNSLEMALSLTVFEIFTLFHFLQKCKMATKSGEN